MCAGFDRAAPPHPAVPGRYPVAPKATRAFNLSAIEGHLLNAWPALKVSPLFAGHFLPTGSATRASAALHPRHSAAQAVQGCPCTCWPGSTCEPTHLGHGCRLFPQGASRFFSAGLHMAGVRLGLRGRLPAVDDVQDRYHTAEVTHLVLVWISWLAMFAVAGIAG